MALNTLSSNSALPINKTVKQINISASNVSVNSVAIDGLTGKCFIEKYAIVIIPMMASIPLRTYANAFVVFARNIAGTIKMPIIPAIKGIRLAVAAFGG